MGRFIGDNYKFLLRAWIINVVRFLEILKKYVTAITNSLVPTVLV